MRRRRSPTRARDKQRLTFQHLPRMLSPRIPRLEILEENIMRKLSAIIASTCLLIGMAACEKKGPLEQAGEEVDEAVQTVKDGKESTATKVDDAIDELKK